MLICRSHNGPNITYKLLFPVFWRKLAISYLCSCNWQSAPPCCIQYTTHRPPVLVCHICHVMQGSSKWKALLCLLTGTMSAFCPSEPDQSHDMAEDLCPLFKPLNNLLVTCMCSWTKCLLWSIPGCGCSSVPEKVLPAEVSPLSFWAGG